MTKNNRTTSKGSHMNGYIHPAAAARYEQRLLDLTDGQLVTELKSLVRRADDTSRLHFDPELIRWDSKRWFTMYEVLVEKAAMADTERFARTGVEFSDS